MNPRFKRTGIVSLFLILLALTLTIYFSIIVIKYPLIGLEVEEKNNQWIVEKIYDKGWADNTPVQEGDVLTLVNGESPEQHSTVFFFNRVEKAESITIKSDDLIEKDYLVSYSQLDFQYIMYLIFPLLFSFISVCLSLFIHNKKKDEKSATILIYFLLTLGVCYISASASARGDILGRILTIITLPGSVILFIHFLKCYFSKYNLVFIKTKLLTLIYSLYLVFLLIMTTLYHFFGFEQLLNNIQLLFFALLFSCLVFLLFRFNFTSENIEGKGIIKILLFTFLIALSPFLLFYALPVLLLNREIISAEVTASFLILIPVVFVYLQVANKLFDIDFILSRIRYYSLLSLPFAIIMSLLLIFILNINFLSSYTLIFFLILYSGIVVFLYIKEYLDYRISHHLFSQKNNFETSLYKFFQKAKHETKVDSLINNLINEIRDVLIVKSVLYFEVVAADENKKIWKVKDNNKQFSKLALDNINWNSYKIGSLIEIKNGFVTIIGGDHTKKQIIFLGLKKQRTNLNIQEKIWLETLSYISSILLENFQLIEDLFHKIEYYNDVNKKVDHSYPSWLSRLLFTLSEKERANLSVDLHDSVLQDLLQIFRKVDNLTEKTKEQSVKKDLYNLKERILDNIHLVRETCNELRPPFLKELGFFESVQLLFEQTKLRANFILHTEIDNRIQIEDIEYELIIYRVVQELLNNAMKHSKANDVKLSLTESNQILTIKYQDNGIGMDITQLKDSFKTIGLSGIRERIKSIGGSVNIYSSPNKGMYILIEVATGSGKGDKGFNYR
ncbi:MAG: ATP-binding protein [Thermoanaerobacterium sp.]|nr:ATP-binding protein [Thermoanaerobacterium sp.]